MSQIVYGEVETRENLVVRLKNNFQNIRLIFGRAYALDYVMFILKIIVSLIE